MKKVLHSEKFYCYFVYFLSVLPFGFLFGCSLCLSAVNLNGIKDEMVYFTNDSVLINIIAILVITGVIILIRKYMLSSISDNVSKSDYVLLIICAIIMTCFSFYWIYASDTMPQDDQEAIFNQALAFNKGDYSELARGGYVAIYRYQLGFISLVRLLTLIDDNFRLVQYFNACLIPIMLYGGFGITKIISNNSKFAVRLYLLAMAICFPIYGYVPFVYGEISSITFSILGCYMMMSALQDFKAYKAVLMGLSLGLAFILRQNTLIMIISCVCVLIVSLICDDLNKKKKSLSLIIALIFGILMFHGLLYFTYHDKTPSDSTEIPAILTIAMGTNDNYGWYNGANIASFIKYEYDVELSNEYSREEIKKYIRACIADKNKLPNDFIRKMNIQWNAPMFQAIVMNNRIKNKQTPLAHCIYFGEGSDILLTIMDYYQSVLYFGVVMFIVLELKNKKAKILQYTSLIACLGGFWFTFIWEAKPRYVLPYLILLIPYMVVGVYRTATAVDGAFKR